MWPGSEQALCGPIGSVLYLALGGVLCSLACPELGSLPGLMSLSQVWMGQALIHGLENPSLVICQPSLRPELVTGPPTSPRNPGLGALGGRSPFIVHEIPSIILKPSLVVPMCLP